MFSAGRAILARMHRRTRGALWPARAATLVAAAVGLVGCRSILGVDGYETFPAPDATASSCQTCMQAHCADEEAACANEQACHTLEACLTKCEPDNDVSCRVTCNLSIRRTTEMSHVIECAARSCAQCAAAHATFGGMECTKCLENAHGSPLKALSMSVPALELEACQQDCSPGFENECPCTDVPGVGLPDGGVDGSTLLNSLRAGTCSAACTQIADWSCLGNLQSIPLGRSDPPQLRLHVRLAAYDVSITQSSPPALVAAEVTACAGEAECTATGFRDAFTGGDTGSADLLLDRPNTGDYFGDLVVRWNETPDQMSTALLYFFPSLRRSPSWTWRRLVSRSLAEALVKPLNIALDWQKNGGIVWSVAACNGLPAADVTATLTPLEDGAATGEQLVYVGKDYVLSKIARATSSIGLGAVISATPGTREMTLRAPDGNIIGKYEFVVVAKGIDEVALYIREIAKEFNVPLVENVALARALESRVKVGRAIPADLYRAVAEVLAFVYRLKGRRAIQA
jgi:type III secretion system FlhB-like substrate exporter